MKKELKIFQFNFKWRQKCSFLTLGRITPKNDAEGCLQDIHWFAGSFGYFPTYTIGAVLAAQIMHHANINIQNLEEKIEMGQFTEFNKFLNKTIHNNGSLFPNANSLINHIFKEKINVNYFKNYIEKKYK